MSDPNFADLWQSARRTKLASVARRLKIGRSVQVLRDIGLAGYLEYLYSKRTHLPAILNAPAILANDTSFELHMLLNHARILEAAWALYSFRWLSQNAGQIVIHDDGSLEENDLRTLRALFPPITVWRRSEADEICESRLKQLGLDRLLRFRRDVVFALKVVDPVILGTTRSVVILDSDVLFYRRPSEILNAAATGRAVYSVCCCFCYSMPEWRMSELIGRDPISLFNSGLFVVDRTKADLTRCNDYLREPLFWSTDANGYNYGELTLWACELSQLNAEALPASYAICPPTPSEFHFGHYCGGGSHHSIQFYTRGLPYARKLMSL